MTSLRVAADITAVTPTVLVLNGPNPNHLGKRQPEIYGATALADAESELRTLVKELGAVMGCRQSDYGSQFIEWVHEAADYSWSVTIDPEGLTHTSVALHDAFTEIADSMSFREVHISDIHAREEFQYYSYLSALAAGVIVGYGTDGYSMALRRVSMTL